MVPIIIIIIIILNKRHRCEEKVELDQQNYWLIAATRTLNEIKKEKWKRKTDPSHHHCTAVASTLIQTPAVGWNESTHLVARESTQMTSFSAARLNNGCDEMLVENKDAGARLLQSATFYFFFT